MRTSAARVRSLLVDRETSRFPYKERPHMPSSPTTPGRASTSVDVPVRVAFRNAKSVGDGSIAWPVRSPVNASLTPSRTPAHELGADVVRYTFIVRDSHPLLLAGLPAHSRLTLVGHERPILL